MRAYRITAIFLFLSTFFLLDAQPLFGQRLYYPLAKGNMWELTPYRRFVTLGDTVVYRDYHHSVLYDSWYGTRSFQRVSGDTVFEATRDTEWVKFRFDVHAGDTLNLRWRDSVHWAGTIVSIDTPTVLGRKLRQWRFSRTSNYMIDADVDTWVTDSVGVTGEATAWGWYTVIGAVIDSITYGIVTHLAEGTFPLHAGDMWQYVDLGFQETFTSKVHGDTILQNGKHYTQLSHSVLPSSFLREAGTKLYAWNQSDSTEYVLFDFSLAPHDTVSKRVQFGAKFAIVFIDAGGGTSSERRWWRFADVRVVDSSYGYEMSRWLVSDSVGVTDITQEPGTVWHLQGAIVNGVQIGTIVSVSSDNAPIPTTTVLHQNYPNPFNPTTTIRYALPHRSHVTLTVFNTLGQQVATLVNGDVDAGVHEVNFNAAGLASGVYFYRLTAGSYIQARKLLLIR